MNTSPPTHLMPGLRLVLVISAGGLAGEVAGVGSRTLLADVGCLGEGWEWVWKVMVVLAVWLGACGVSCGLVVAGVLGGLVVFGVVWEMGVLLAWVGVG